MLRINDLKKYFGGVAAVDGVSFEAAAGEIFALIGPNGSGKTTILKTVAGLLRPTEGNITVEGASVVGHPIETKAKIGYIPDEPAIWPRMTGLEFLHFTGALFGMSEEERARAIPELLAIFGLAGIEAGYFENYSRGNKQKFTILAALLHEPKLLLIDEPIVGLDPESAEVAKKKFGEFAWSGGAILVATHTLPVAEEIATRVGVLKEGKLAAAGTVAELRTRARLPTDASLAEVYQALT